jgi:metal-responsive CopG/Arc/MetJ family transcriptional regulator
MIIARKQTLVQLTDELVRLLDQRAAREHRSRSAVIRTAIESYLHDEREAEIDREIVAAYTRVPQTEEEHEWAEVGMDDMLRRLEEDEGSDGW